MDRFAPESLPDLPVENKRNPRGDDVLTLNELDRDAVLDPAGATGQPPEMLTFGGMREACPHCRTTSLKLVLRQRSVRLAHLFCTRCGRCYEARYPNGRCALTV